MSAALEIATLRAEEDGADRFYSEIDRLCRRLMSSYACNFAICAAIPDDQWAAVPASVAHDSDMTIPIRAGRIPRETRGTVLVNINTLRRLAL